MTATLAGFSDGLRNCRGVLVDSNVLLDITTSDLVWSEWSGETLAAYAEYSMLVINPIVYAEVSIGCSTIEALDSALPGNLYRREQLLWEANFLADKCFLNYRRRGGARLNPLRTSTSEPTLRSANSPC